MITTYRLEITLFKNYKGELITCREWWKNDQFWNEHYYQVMIDRNFKPR